MISCGGHLKYNRSDPRSKSAARSHGVVVALPSSKQQMRTSRLNITLPLNTTHDHSFVHLVYGNPRQRAKYHASVTVVTKFKHAAFVHVNVRTTGVPLFPRCQGNSGCRGRVRWKAVRGNYQAASKDGPFCHPRCHRAQHYGRSHPAEVLQGTVCGGLARCLSALPRYHTAAQQGVDVAHVPGGSTERCFSFWFPPATLVGVEEGLDGRMWVHRAQLIHDKPGSHHCCCRAATVPRPRSAVEIIVCSTGSFRKARLRYM